MRRFQSVDVVLIVVSGFLLSIAGCASNPSSITGSWKLNIPTITAGDDTKRQMDTTAYDGPELAIIFKSDGAYQSSIRLNLQTPAKVETGTYRVAGSRVFLTHDGREYVFAEIDGDQLILRGKTMLDVFVLKRQ